MERDYDDDDAPRRRRYEDEYDEDRETRRRPERSGVVIGVAVVNFLLGALFVIVGLLCLFAAIMMLTSGGRRDRDDAWQPLMLGFGLLIIGVGYVVSGIGLLGQRNWGRIITLILGGFNFAGALLGMFGMVLIIAEGRRLRDETIFALFFSCASVVINLGYGVFVYATLLRSRIAAEFR